MFSREEEIKYARRFEEGYDLYDKRYLDWLSVSHPEKNHATVTTTSYTFPSSSTYLQAAPSQPMSTFVTASEPVPPVLFGSSTESMCINSTDVPLMFSREEEMKYARRFQEGYDIYDPRYLDWLSLHHLESARANNETPITISCTFTSSSTYIQTSPLQSTSTVVNAPKSAPHSLSTPSREGVVNPTRLTYNQLTPTSNSSVPLSTYSCTPSSCSSGNSEKRSPLSELINVPNINNRKTVKTGSARVLTSNECLKAFEEKEQKKRLEAEEKQKRKEEREQKKN